MTSENGAGTPPTLALSTKLEEEFVSPLTAIRGALEILRDFPELSLEDRERFVTTALKACDRLKLGVEHLGATVYAAGERALTDSPKEQTDSSPYASRIRILDDHEAIEVDFSDFEFSSSKIVNDFYDVLDKLIENSGRHWYIVVNYRNCSIWPEAWVAFAHRGKKVNVSYSLGTVRYVEDDDKSKYSGWEDPDMFESRELALAHIDELRSSGGTH